jgi:hypothetical protein
MVFDQGEGSDILDAIVAEGRCGTCGKPWDRVVKVDGKPSGQDRGRLSQRSVRAGRLVSTYAFGLVIPS